MEKNIDSYIITKTMSIYEAMQIINQNASKTAFLVEDRKLNGVVSDGDIRRFILNGGNINDSVQQVVNPKPVFLYHNSTPPKIIISNLCWNSALRLCLL